MAFPPNQAETPRAGNCSTGKLKGPGAGWPPSAKQHKIQIALDRDQIGSTTPASVFTRKRSAAGARVPPGEGDSSE